MNSAIDKRQVDYVFRQLRVTGWPHALAVALTAFVLWRHDPSLAVMLWCGFFLLTHVLRILLLDRWWMQARSDAEYRRLRWQLTASMLTAGSCWGVVPVLFMQSASPDMVNFLSLVLAGMICATLPALAACLQAYFAFVLPVFLGLIVHYHGMGLSASAFLIFAFLGAMLAISTTVHRIITGYISLDLENQTLLQEVTRARDDAEHANQSKSNFLAAASHDLRQPLQALGFFLECINFRVGDGDPELHTLARQALGSHESLSELLNALLELSRLESRELNVRRQHFLLRQFLQPIVNEYQSLAQAKGLSLVLSGDDAVVESDPVLLARVARNLLDNAVKFTGDGSIVVRLLPETDGVQLTVTDTGVGIAEADQTKVFTEYFQVDNDARQASRGLGLGLSIVSRICRLLNLPLGLTSSVGIGTTVRVMLPRGDEGQVLRPVSSQQLDLSGHSVLVVDDDPVILQALAALLRDWGCTAWTAVGLEDALAQLGTREDWPDLVLSDYRLDGGVHGIDLIRAVRERTQADLPALLMSGDTDPALVQSIRQQQFHLLHKPVKPVQLRKVMHQLLAGA